MSSPTANFPVNLLFAGDQVRYAARDSGKSGGAFDVVFMLAPHATDPTATPVRIDITAVEGETRESPRDVGDNADEPLEVIRDERHETPAIPATRLDMPVSGFLYNASVRVLHRGLASGRGPHPFSQGTWDCCRIAVRAEFSDHSSQMGYSEPFRVTGNGTTKSTPAGAGSSAGGPARAGRARAAGSRASASASARAARIAGPAAAPVPVYPSPSASMLASPHASTLEYATNSAPSGPASPAQTVPSIEQSFLIDHAPPPTTPPPTTPHDLGGDAAMMDPLFPLLSGGDDYDNHGPPDFGDFSG